MNISIFDFERKSIFKISYKSNRWNI